MFIIVNYVRKIKHNDSFTNERFNKVPRCEIAKACTQFTKLALDRGYCNKTLK